MVVDSVGYCIIQGGHLGLITGVHASLPEISLPNPRMPSPIPVCFVQSISRC